MFALLAGGGSPAALVDRGPFTSDFFDEQAAALLDGHLDVDPQVAGIEGFAHGGRTHLYFGLVPALLRLPVVAVTDAYRGRLVVVSMLAALGVACAATSRILWRARRSVRGRAPLARGEAAVAGAFVASLGLASPLLFLASRAVVYHEVELWGSALALVALAATLAWAESPSWRRLALASLATTAAFSTRASVGSGAVAALGLVAGTALLRRRVPWRHLPAIAVALALPLAAYAAVNVARFGSPFSVPFEYQVFTGTDRARQAAMEATDGTLFGIDYVPTALLAYLRPDGVVTQPVFPWLGFRDAATLVGHPTFDTVDRAASLPVVAPALLALGLVGIATAVRRRCAPWLAVVAGAAAGLTSTLTIAFLANRYLADFTPPLVVAAALGLWAVVDWTDRRGSRWRRSVLGVGALATAAGLVVSLAIGVQAQRLFVLPDPGARRDLVALQYQRFHGPISRVRTTTGNDLGLPRTGAIRVVGLCAGLYWSDGRSWFPLELGGDRRYELRGEVRPGDSEVLVAPGWRLLAERVSGGVRVRFGAAAGIVTTGRSSPRPVRRGPVHVDVTLDRVGSELAVAIDGEEVLRLPYVDIADDPVVAAGWTRAASATPLCDDLRARLLVADGGDQGGGVGR